jgi:hypothetical protein
MLDSESANLLRIKNKKGEILSTNVENIRINRTIKINELPSSP